VSWTVYAGVFAVLIVGSTVQASVGMGQGLVSAPLLRLLHPDLLPGPIVMAGFFVSVGLAVANSRRSDVGEVTPALVGRTAGIGIALVLLATLSERGLTVVIGGIVLVLVALRVIGLQVARTPRTLLATGVVSGVGGTIAGLAGAPMGLLYEQHARARDFRGPMGIYLSVGAFITVVLLVVFGELNGDDFWLGMALLPPILVGLVLARWVTPIVDRGLLKPAVFGLSAASATVLILGEFL
jgi:uncharacterized membrane protein YfcA